MRGRSRGWPVVAAVAALLVAACTGPVGREVRPSGGPAGPVAPSPGAPATSSSPVSSRAAPATPPGPTSLRFSVLGDVGEDAHAAAVLDGIAARRDDLTLVVGDLSYGRPGSEREWCRFVTRHLGARHPVELVAGNHEDDGPNGDIDVFARCLPNRLSGLVGQYGRQWYADVPADRPLVRFVMVSPGLDFGSGPWSYAEGTSHHAWTQRAVTGARAAGIPWVVVGMHEPCLSVGVYPCSPGPDLLDLLVRSGVDLVVTGHEHMYQRTVALGFGPGCPAVRPERYDAACVRAHGGTTFVTVGTGGHPLRDGSPADPERPYFAAVSAADEDPAWGSLAVEVTPERLAARFVPAAGSDFTDAFTLRR